MGTGTNQEQISYWNEQGGPRWVLRQRQLDAQIQQLGLAAMQKAEVKPAEQVLDVGCGCGQTSLELAQRVSPHGSVLGIDISHPMLARARDRQHELGVTNLEFLNTDAQTHRFAPESFDLIFSRFGVMFFANPLAAFTNLHTALRPKGRLCFVCWQALDKNAWASVPLKAAMPYLPPLEPSTPGTPGPFAFADPDRVCRILEEAGFIEVRCESHEAELSTGGAATVEEAVEFSLEIGVVARLLREAEATVRARVVEAVRAALTPYAKQQGVHLKGAAWIVSAKPSR
ncbi:MAG: class I SAM-dependent methyltransferase [Candidatus Binatia bacterium]